MQRKQGKQTYQKGYTECRGSKEHRPVRKGTLNAEGARNTDLTVRKGTLNAEGARNTDLSERVH